MLELQRLSRVRVTGLGVLIASFVLLRLVATVGDTTRFSDTGTYFQLNFLGNDERLWTVPLIWNLLGSDQLRQVFQIGLALVAWPMLAGAVMRLIGNRWLALLAAAGVLLIGLVPQVTGWDSTMLSESLSTSLLVLLCALLLRMSIGRSPRLVAFTLLVTVCWAFTGQSSALLFLALLPFVLVFCGRRLDGRERLAVAAALVAIGGWSAYAITRDKGASQAVPTYTAVQIIENRIAPNPVALRFLTARGMPPSPAIAAERGNFPGDTSPLFTDPRFMTWIHQRFRWVYTAYLLRRWPSTLTDPFRHTPAAVTGSVTAGLPGRSLLPLPLRNAVWGPGPAQIIVWLVALVLCAGVALVRRARVRSVPVIGLLLLGAAIGALLTWNLTGYEPGEGELARLFLPVAVVLRIAIVLAVALSLDALLAVRAASAAARVVTVSPSPGRTWVPNGVAGLLGPSEALARMKETAGRTIAELRSRSPIETAGAALARTGTDAAQAFRRRVSRVRVTGLGLLIAAFAVLRLVATVGDRVSFPDTGTYLQLNFLGNDTRLWTVPLIWNLLGSDHLRQAFQIGLGLVAWPMLAAAVTRLISNRWLALIAAAGVLLIGLVPQVTGWDSTMLSESLSTSLLVLLCALLLRMSIGRSPRLVAFALFITICWAFARTSNALLFVALLPFLLVFCVRRLHGRERLVVAAALVVIGGWGAYALTRDTPASDAVWTWNAVQIIENRIAPNPAALRFLTARGMPPSPVIAAERGNFPGGTSPLFSDPVFMTWIHQRFRPVYAAYLLHRWPSTLTDPFRHTPGAITGPVTGGLPGRTVLPSALRDLVWGPGPAQILVWLAAMAVCAGIALIRRARIRCIPVIGLLLLSAAFGALLTWNLTGYGSGELIARGPGELARIFLPVAVVLRVAIVLMITLSLDALLATRAACVTARVGSLSPSPPRTWVPSGVAGLLQSSGSLARTRPLAGRIAAEWRPHSPLAIAGAALTVTLVVLPELDRAAPAGAATLTPARFLIAFASVAAIVDIVRQRSLRVLWRPLTMALLVSLLAGVVLVWSSAATNGCNCRGSAAGLGEFASAGALATYVLARDRVWASRFICAAAIGALLAAILAVPALASGARATGSYGNPNNLAFALALGVPLIVAAAIDARNAKARAALTTLAVLLAGVTFLTYSRGGLLAMAAGLVVFAALRAPATRARAVIGAAVICLVGAGVVLYPAFAGSRIDADIASGTTPSLILHQSGWDPVATGLIPAGTSSLAHQPDGSLRIVAHGAGEGASLSIGHASAGVAYTVSVAARSLRGVTYMVLGLEDNKRALSPRIRKFRLAGRWRSYHLTWTPSASASHARVYAWVETSASFALTDVTLRVGRSRPVTSRLTTEPVSPRALSRAQAAHERQDLHFRSRMLSLAWRAFVDHPLRGIGWEQFPRYVAARSDYGRQGAQSEYARYAAELGIGGVLFLIALALTAVVALWRDFPHRPAVAGSLAVAAVGLAFDNALETVSISAITAVMLAIACTRGKKAGSRRGPDV